jgi:hypothetical protein
MAVLVFVVCLQVPDVDFLVHLGDGCPAGLPLVQSNINRSNKQAGFTIPMHMWKQALGPEQFAVLAECLQVRNAGKTSWVAAAMRVQQSGRAHCCSRERRAVGLCLIVLSS